MLLSHLSVLVMVVPRNLKCSTTVTDELLMTSGRCVGTFFRKSTLGIYVKCSTFLPLQKMTFFPVMTFFPSHVCRHSDGAPAVSADMFGGQTCIRQGKGGGGMKGILTNPEQVAVWIQSFGICSHLSQSLDDM